MLWIAIYEKCLTIKFFAILHFTCDPGEEFLVSTSVLKILLNLIFLCPHNEFFLLYADKGMKKCFYSATESVLMISQGSFVLRTLFVHKYSTMREEINLMAGYTFSFCIIMAIKFFVSLTFYNFYYSIFFKDE